METWFFFLFSWLVLSVNYIIFTLICINGLTLSLKPETSPKDVFSEISADVENTELKSLQRSLVTWLQFLQSHVKHLCNFSERLQNFMVSRITIFITSVQPNLQDGFKHWTWTSESFMRPELYPVSYLSLYNLPCKADKSLSCRLLASRPDVWIHLVDFAARSKTSPSLKLSFQSSLDVCDWSGNHVCL